MAYRIREPARAPTGAYYDVCASPRGDLLVYFSETGPATWLSANVGVFGILSFLINLLVFRRRWRVVVRPAQTSGFANPTSGVICRRDVAMKAARTCVEETARLIEERGLAALGPGVR